MLCRNLLEEILNIVETGAAVLAGVVDIRTKLIQWTNYLWFGHWPSLTSACCISCWWIENITTAICCHYIAFFLNCLSLKVIIAINIIPAQPFLYILFYFFNFCDIFTFIFLKHLYFETFAQCCLVLQQV